MAWGNSTKFKSRGDALSRAKARHVCLDCRYWQPKTYKECPQCGSKNRQYFMSESEHHRGIGLLTMQAAGKISDLKFQVPFVLMVNGIKLGKYIADFTFKDEHGVEICEDFKGSKDHIEPLSKWKLAHMQAQYGITVKITQGK